MFKSKKMLSMILSLFMVFQVLNISKLVNASPLVSENNVISTDNIDSKISENPFGMTFDASTVWHTVSRKFVTRYGSKLAISSDLLYPCTGNQTCQVSIYAVEGNSNSFNEITTPKLVYTHKSTENQRSKVLYLKKNTEYKLVIVVSGVNLPETVRITVGCYNY